MSVIPEQSKQPQRPTKVTGDYIREHEIALLKLLIPRYPGVALDEVRKIVLDKRK